jgi:tRNA pseudouridine55 synthase
VLRDADRLPGIPPRIKSCSGQLAHTDQEYVSIGLLGATTTSYDAESPVITTGDFDNVTREDIEKILDRFRGTIKQTPPM